MKRLDECLKVAEVARFLGICQNTLRKWADDGRIPVRANPANGSRLFRREDLESFLKETAKPTVKKRTRR